MRKPKVGRFASDKERSFARGIVDLYRKAMEKPNGMLPVETEEGGDFYFDGNDPAEAVQALENFAKYGTFQWVYGEPARLLSLNIEYDELRESGMRYGDAIAALALSQNTSERNIERYLKKPLLPLVIENSSYKAHK
jgi:hypothetical protein